MKSQPTPVGDNHRTDHRNLRPPWQRGQSGNPGGRPKRKSFTELANEYLGEPCDDDPTETRMGRLVRAIVDRAIRGDRTAVGELLSRIDPAPRNNITIHNGASRGDEVLAVLDQLRGTATAESFKSNGHRTNQTSQFDECKPRLSTR